MEEEPSAAISDVNNDTVFRKRSENETKQFDKHNQDLQDLENLLF
jgi:hypothetical protein